MKYKKKPVVIEAVRYDYTHLDHNLDCFDSRPEWLIYALDNGILFFDEGDLLIKTLEGVMLVSNGDYIIQGIEGELYPCKPAIFKETYEKVDELANQSKD